MGGKEVFEIKRGDKVEKVSGEELGQKLTEIEYSDGSTLTAKPGDNRRSTFVEGVHTNKSGTIEAK